MRCDAAEDGVCLLCVFGGSAVSSVALSASFVVMNPRRGRADTQICESAQCVQKNQLHVLTVRPKLQSGFSLTTVLILLLHYRREVRLQTSVQQNNSAII